MRLKTLDCIALTIAIIGAVNWGLIGFSILTLSLLFLAACPGCPGSSMPSSASVAFICSHFTRPLQNNLMKHKTKKAEESSLRLFIHH